MEVRDFMHVHVHTIQQTASLRQAMQVFSTHLIGILPVLDDVEKLCGVLMIEDALKKFMPKFVEMIDEADFVRDYGSLEHGLRSVDVDQIMVADLMHPRFYVYENDGLMSPIVMMYKKRVNDIPVVDRDKKVVGIVSHARTGSVFLKEWLAQENVE